MAPARPVNKSRGVGQSILWDMLTFERLLTGPVIHLIYWAGLGVVLIGGFGALGVAVGVAWRGDTLVAKLLALPAGVVGLLITGMLALLWRSFCEFYVAIFRISDDLRALRQNSDADHALKP